MTIIQKTKYLDFMCTKSPSNHDWYYVRRTNDSQNHDSAVVITTIVKSKDGYDFLFLKTSRPPITAENKAKYCIESPAGLIGDIDKNENLIECAQKELLEEAGLKADKLFVELTNSCLSSGISSETMSYVSAFVSSKDEVQQPVNDGGIIVDRFYVPINDVMKYFNSLNNKEISISASTVCGIFYALERFKNLQNVL